MSPLSPASPWTALDDRRAHLALVEQYPALFAASGVYRYWPRAEGFTVYVTPGSGGEALARVLERRRAMLRVPVSSGEPLVIPLRFVVEHQTVADLADGAPPAAQSAPESRPGAGRRRA